MQTALRRYFSTVGLKQILETEVIPATRESNFFLIQNSCSFVKAEAMMFSKKLESMMPS